jgi:hypothetical protein
MNNMAADFSSINQSTLLSTVQTTTPNDPLNSTTTKSKILTYLFLQSTTCQIMTGFFAWAALLITSHHVIIG